jgi:hypothetical protein
MTETEGRSLEIIAAMRKQLDEAEQALTDGHLTSEGALKMESALVGISISSFYVHLTGQRGYDPQKVFEKCTGCGHYRIT